MSGGNSRPRIGSCRPIPASSCQPAARALGSASPLGRPAPRQLAAVSRFERRPGPCPRPLLAPGWARVPCTVLCAGRGRAQIEETRLGSPSSSKQPVLRPMGVACGHRCLGEGWGPGGPGKGELGHSGEFPAAWRRRWPPGPLPSLPRPARLHTAAPGAAGPQAGWPGAGAAAPVVGPLACPGYEAAPAGLSFWRRPGLVGGGPQVAGR